MNIESLTHSEIRNMSIECDKVGGFNLSQGISNLNLNNKLVEGIDRALKRGFNYYTQFDGDFELKNALSKKIISYNKINLDNKKIIVTSGATGAFYCACFAVLKPNDEVIVFEPYYGYHIKTIEAVGAKPTYVTLKGKDFDIDFEELENIITDRTKAILICTPSNPCGKIFSENDLQKLGLICKKNNLIVFTDEIYEYFLYDNKEHVSPGSLEIFDDNTITISGYSKTFSITGWRIGYCVVPEKYFEPIGHISDLFYVCSPSVLQNAVAYGINEINKNFYYNLIKKFTYKRDLLCSVLFDIGLNPTIPKGSYYIMADASSVDGKTSKEKAMQILNDTKVACVPGSEFYHSNKGENFVRFCFAKEDEILNQACNNLLKLNK